MKNLILNIIAMAAIFLNMNGQSQFEKDEFQTPSGKLTIYFIGHASLMFEINNKIIYADPVSKYADFSKFPKADIILITHHHGDHLDIAAINDLTKNETQIILTGASYETLKKGIIMKNGHVKNIDGFEIEAVPAYNVTEGRNIYHPKGRDNGYVITLDDKRIYIAGDTENIPEMSSLKNIDIAFLPMNQPYTMLPEQVAEAANRFNPKILYPYHTGDTDVSKLKPLLAYNKNIEVRIKPMK